MKARLLLASLCVVCSTASVFGMDAPVVLPVAPESVKKVANVDRYLRFVLNRNYEITEYGSKNMKFFADPDEFVGKKITESLPLNKHDKKAITRGLKGAKASNGETEHLVPYTLDNIRFCAGIKYIEKKKKFSVKVTQSATIE